MRIPRVRKATAAGIGIPIAVIAVWAIKAFGHISVPAEVAAAIGSVASFILVYVIPER